MSALKPYWGKPAVRNFREGDGNNGIIEARSAPSPYSTVLNTKVRVEMISPCDTLWFFQP
jgi:hypothetical protein